MPLMPEPSTATGCPWRVRAVTVRDFNCGLRWTLDASTNDLTTTITADTSHDGDVVDLQRDDYVGTTGDVELDREVRERIADLLALRTVLQSLNAIDRRRWGRVQQPNDRRRWAA
jgi:hypothetical protein